MAHADDDREFVGRDVVVCFVRLDDIASELEGIGEALGIPGVEDDAVPGRGAVQPVVLRVARGLPAANGGERGACSIASAGIPRNERRIMT